MGIEHDLRGKAGLNAVIQLIAMPGYVCSVLFLPKVGLGTQLSSSGSLAVAQASHLPSADKG